MAHLKIFTIKGFILTDQKLEDVRYKKLSKTRIDMGVFKTHNSYI